jgi:hypothetical protein
MELLTLHSVVDGPVIPGNTLLASIQKPLGSYDQPLIIGTVNDGRKLVNIS